MPAIPATIGLDIGTSATKGVLIAQDGSVLARAVADYPLLTPQPGWSEQRPEDWWRACVGVLRELTAVPGVDILALGLSGQMHGSVFLDGDGEVIRPALLWNDARTHAEVAEIERRLGREQVIAITGNLASTGMQAPKILWLRANEPEAASRIARVLLPKDFIRFRLSGAAFSDPSDASGTLLLDLAARRYSPTVLEALDIPAAWLPELVESWEPAGSVSADAAALTGLRPGLPLVGGGGDNACAAIGAGIVEVGEGACSLGTSGTLFLRSDRPVTDPAGALNAFCDAAGGWHLMGVILSAGGAVRWFTDALAEGESLPALLEEALALPQGTEGLVFLPYLSGERSPHMDPHARGAWIGLSLAHRRPHLLRAVVEGVGCAFADCLERMRGLGLAPSNLALVGGGARSAAWRRLLATQLQVDLTLPAAEEGPALGAAILARVGAGMDPDVATAARRIVPADAGRETPDTALIPVYQALHRKYQRLYPALKTTYAD